MQPVHSFVWAMHFKTDTHFRVLCVSLTRTCDTYASNDTNYVCCCCLCVWAPLHCVWMCVCGHEVHFLPTTRQNTSSRRGTHHTHTGVERERESYFGIESKMGKKRLRNGALGIRTRFTSILGRGMTVYKALTSILILFLWWFVAKQYNNNPQDTHTGSLATTDFF